MTEPWLLGIIELSRQIAEGALTPAALVESLIARSERLDGRVHAWARLSTGSARECARRLTEEAAAGHVRSALHGVPVAIKDIFYTAGIETSVGSRRLAGFVPKISASVVRRLEQAGAIVLGKTAMTEFAAMDPAPTRNPWNLAHTPGGSSSGSAAALAAYFVPAALGTQTAGSIIRPSAYCGVVGLKPTYDRIDREGVYPCAWSMDHIGPMARCVEDVALLFQVMAGMSAAPEMAAKKSLRIGFADRYFLDQADSDTRTAFDSSLALLERSGAELVPLTLPPSTEAAIDAGVVTMYAEMAALHGQAYRAQPLQYGWKLGFLIEAGLEVSASDYLRAQQIRRTAAAELSAMLQKVDCLLTPSTPSPAPEGLDSTGDWSFNLLFSALGHPALSLPVAMSGSGMPLGMQLVADKGQENRLFECGALLERLVQFQKSPFKDF